MKTSVYQKSQFEFIAIMASLMAITSLAMDALLPALGEIGNSLGITQSNQNQLLITMIFLGLGIGQLLSGPLSDSLGRKPVIYIGFSIFIIGSILSVYADNLGTMITGRLIQGIGLSAPKSVSMAIVRDSYQGDVMAKIMSFVIVIFILVPTIAPAYGKYMLDTFGWESIFNSQILIAILVSIWFGFRQKETLTKERKTPFNAQLFKNGLKQFFQSKTATLYTIILGFVTGSFLVFLSTAQTILGEQYNKQDEFPMLFAAVALTVGVSTFLNGLFVVKIGMKRLIFASSIIFTLIAFTYVVMYYGEANPSITIVMAFLMILFLAFGFLFGNLSALAMEPLGKIAGMGAAINGTLSTLIAVPIAGFIGSFIQETAFPLFAGFFATGLISVILLIIARKMNI